MPEGVRSRVISAAAPILLVAAAGAGVYAAVAYGGIIIGGGFWVAVMAGAAVVVWKSRSGLRGGATAVSAVVAMFVVSAASRGNWWPVSGLAAVVFSAAVHCAAGYFCGEVLFRSRKISVVEKTVLGLGVLGTSIFLLGVAGLFYPVVVGAAVLVPAAASCYFVAGGRWRIGGGGEAGAISGDQGGTEAKAQGILVLSAAAAVCAVIVIVTLLPHVHGAEDDYDVLEYHLQLPDEYLREHRVAVKTHNLFSALPQLCEMLFASGSVTGGVLGKVLPTGDPHMKYAQQMGAKGVNLLFLVLMVGALFGYGREWGGEGMWRYWGGFAVLFVMWTIVLATGAMVEIMLATFCIVSVGIMARWGNSVLKGDASSESYRLLAGGAAAAGMAAAVKYSGWLFAGVPLAVAATVAAVKLREKRMFAVPAAAAGLFVIPWAAYSHYYTGNPFHPFLLRLFDERMLTTETAARWMQGFAAQRGIGRSTVETVGNIVGYPGTSSGGGGLLRLGPYGATVVAVIAAVLAACAWKVYRRRAAKEGDCTEVDSCPPAVRGVAAVVLWGAASWLLLTHRHERFLYPVYVIGCSMVPLMPGVLKGLGCRMRWLWAPASAAAVAGALVSGGAMLQRSVWEAAADGGPVEYVTRMNPAFQAVRRTWQVSGRTLVIGESQAFYFPADTIYATPYDHGSAAGIINAMEGINEGRIRAALDAAFIDCVYVDSGELVRTKARYRKGEMGLLPDVGEAAGGVFLKYLEDNWRCEITNQGGMPVFVYTRPPESYGGKRP